MRIILLALLSCSVPLIAQEATEALNALEKAPVVLEQIADTLTQDQPAPALSKDKTNIAIPLFRICVCGIFLLHRLADQENKFISFAQGLNFLGLTISSGMLCLDCQSLKKEQKNHKVKGLLSCASEAFVGCAGVAAYLSFRYLKYALHDPATQS